MTQVLLFRPREQYSARLRSRRAPLSLLYLASAVRNAGYSVRILDAGVDDRWEAALGDALGSDTICCGVTVMTGHQIRGALDFARAVRNRIHVPIVWGGLHASLLPEQTIGHELVDLILVGEGEERFPALVRTLESGEKLDAIPGLWHKPEGTPLCTGDLPAWLDLDRLPFPAYDLIDSEHYATQYRRFMLGRKRCLDINTDRGCPSRCGYCYNLRFNRRRWRAAGAEAVLDWTGRLQREYRLDAVNFTSDNFFVDINRVRAVSQGLLDRGLDLHWHADIRIDLFLRYDDETLSLMRRSGCTTLTFGVESGSDRMLEGIGKETTVDAVRQAHERLQRLGFLANYHFMIGFPDETPADARATLKLMWEIGRAPNVMIYGPSIFLPFPGTPLFDRSLALGFRPPERLEDWADYDWEMGCKSSWFTPAYRNFLEECYQVGSGALECGEPRSAGERLRRAYFRLRFLGLLHGVRAWGLDQKLVRAVKRLLR